MFHDLPFKEFHMASETDVSTLVGQVVRVSVETVEIVKNLPKELGG